MSRQAPTTPQRGNLAARTEGTLQVRLAGPVSCRAYSISNVIRLGNVTVVIGDRYAAISVATAALILGDLAMRLGPTYQHRFTQMPKASSIEALVTLKGTQNVDEVELRSKVDRCGEASLTIGDLRITVCDRDAAARVAAALGAGYDEATYRFAHLRPFADLKEQRADRRRANAARRLGHIRT